ncbi:hypothetical protein SOVF_051550, partial [Spinacia oleracea]
FYRKISGELFDSIDGTVSW